MDIMNGNQTFSFLVHHAGALLVYYITLTQPIGQIYACYYTGVSSFSTFFLCLRSRDMQLPKYMFSFIDFAFAISFGINRLGLWSWMNYFYWSDVLASPFTWELFLHGCGNVLLTCL